MPDRVLTSADVELLNRQFTDKTPLELLNWAVNFYGDRIGLCSAFGPEGMVLLHLISRLERPITVFTLDTGRLPQETHQLMQRCEELYGIRIDVYAPEPADICVMVKQHGINLFLKSVQLRELCCEIRKVRPLIRALDGLSAWITGLRRLQASSRQRIERFEIDHTHSDIVKLNPLAGWSEEQVWNYINLHELPYNALHDRGYRSIGCACCTRPTNPGEDIRAGRWWWEENSRKECGLHSPVSDARVDLDSTNGAVDVRRRGTDRNE
jgi:thioredoxin-dependent adenylylsulfate APS reductase